MRNWIIDSVILVTVGALVCLGASAAAARTLASPTISGFSPIQALHGQKVTIDGSGFSGTTSVQFGGIEAQFTVVSDSKLTAIVPGEVGAGKWTIDVLTKTGEAGSSTMFNVLPGGAVILHKGGLHPRISSVFPTRGHPGTYLIITGVNLGGALWVKLGGVKIPYTVPSATRINAVISRKARPGRLTLLNNYGLATSPTRITIIPRGAVLAAHH
jgi:hypothetical protein